MTVPTIEPASTVDAMTAAGVDTEDSLYEDYFGFDEKHEYYLPDGNQYIEFQVLNEGARAKYQKKTNRDLTVSRTTDEARIKVDQAADRHALIESSVTGWYMFRKNPRSGKFEQVEFTTNNLMTWVNGTNPKLVDGLLKEINKANPWLMGERTLEEIDKEIADLTELREVLEREQREKEDSSNK